MNVWVTRDEWSGGPLSAALASFGLTAVVEPVLARHVIDDASAELERLTSDDWLVLTSPFAVKTVNLGRATTPKVAVVSESSRRAALANGMRVEWVSKKGTAADLFDSLRNRVNTGRVCYPRSNRAKPIPPWASVDVTSPVIYEIQPRPFDTSIIQRIDVITVTSPSAVTAVGPRSKPFASIGPTTTRALNRIGVTPHVEAPQRSFSSLAQAINVQLNG